jgi:ribosomal protein L40E
MAIKVPVKRGSSDVGEFAQDEFIQKLKSGIISCYDKIYYSKNDEWIDIYKIKGISEYISEDLHWRYRIQGEVRGPLAKTDLIFFIKEGKISAKDWVFHPSIGKWKKVEDVEEFKPAATESEGTKQKETALDEALQSGFYKICPNCGMQNLKNATSCKGCKYIFKGNE